MTKLFLKRKIIEREVLLAQEAFLLLSQKSKRQKIAIRGIFLTFDLENFLRFGRARSIETDLQTWF